MLTSIVGVDDKGEPYVYDVGQEYELPASEAKALCEFPKDSPRAEPVAVKRSQRAEKRPVTTRVETR